TPLLSLGEGRAPLTRGGTNTAVDVDRRCFLVNPQQSSTCWCGAGRRTDAFLSRFGQGMGVLYRQGCARAHDPWGRTGACDDEDPERFSSVLLPSHVRVGGRPRSRHLAQLTARCVPCSALDASAVAKQSDVLPLAATVHHGLSNIARLLRRYPGSSLLV